MTLKDWELKFSTAISGLNKHNLSKAGALLSVIPSHAEWDGFLFEVNRSWPEWRKRLSDYPYSLILLFSGLAFYEYSSKALWRPFAEAVGVEALSPNEQATICQAYAHKARQIGLKILEKDGRIYYVGSAVYQVGIPLSLWGDFLELCEWAMWHESWKVISVEEWDLLVKKLFPGIKRLQNFLLENKETALAFIKEMVDARVVSKDDNLTIPELAKMCLLRVEYFEEVPETLDFLRPNSGSSFDGLAKVFWSDFKQRISLYLPSVPQDQLPAMWEIDGLKRPASSTPHELVIDSKALKATLIVKFTSKENTNAYYVRGLDKWGLFDLSRGGVLVNSKRDVLPLGNYILISQEPLANIELTGFDDVEAVRNEQITLDDGVNCFITKLWPASKYAELIVKLEEKECKIVFRRRARIETNFFVGELSAAGNFRRLDGGCINIERLPILYISIPKGYFADNCKELTKRFSVFLDERQAGGSWIIVSRSSDDEKEFFRWEWGQKPFLEKDPNKKGNLKGLQNIGQFFRSPDLRGEHVLSIRALPGFDFSYKVFIEHSKKGMERCFSDLPGEYLIWYLLSQDSKGMKWDEIIFTKDVIAPNMEYSPRKVYNLLKDYSASGLVGLRGRLWGIEQTMARLSFIAGQTLMQYCGDPSILWVMYRKMYHCDECQPLPVIEVVKGKSGLPYLQMKWPLKSKSTLRNFLVKNKVRICEGLWGL